MAATAKPKSADAKSSGPPSFRKRFHAWWHGYELRAPGRGNRRPAQRASRVGAEGGTEAPEDADAGSADVAVEDDASRWSAARQRVAQMAWGDGFVSPGGEERVMELVGRLGLDESSSLIEIGSGLGGGTRAIAQRFGIYVTGWDLDAALAREATIQARYHSLDRKAAVRHLAPEKLELKTEFYAGALVRETLYRVEDKEALIRKVAGSLKRSSQIVIDDLFFEHANAGQAIAQWAANEAAPVFPWTIDAARSTLERSGVEVRVAEDESSDYCAAAVKAWGDFAERAETRPLAPELAVPTMREVEYWARRVAALDSGILRLYRIIGLKRSPSH